MGTGGTAENPIDQTVLGRIRELDDEGENKILVRVVHLFLNQANENVETLVGALESGNAETAAEMAHGLKSSSANLGAMAFSRLCAEIELSMREGKGAGNPTWGEEVKQQYEAVKAALISEIS